MRISQRAVSQWMGAGALGSFILFYGAGCQTSLPVPVGVSEQALADQGTTLPGEAQLSFDSPEAATQALQDAVNASEKGELHRLFGPSLSELVSGDAVEDKNCLL